MSLVRSRHHLLCVRNLFSCLLNTSCSFGKLSAHVLITDCSSVYVLCLCGGLGSSLLPSLLSSFGFSLSNLLRGLSQLLLQSPWLLQGPVTVELFAPPVVSMLLLLKRFLDGLHLVFQLSRLQFLCGFPRHLVGVTSHRCDSLRLCAGVVFTFVASVAVDTSSIMDVCLYSSRSSQSPAFC